MSVNESEAKTNLLIARANAVAMNAASAQNTLSASPLLLAEVSRHVILFRRRYCCCYVRRLTLLHLTHFSRAVLHFRIAHAHCARRRGQGEPGAPVPCHAHAYARDRGLRRLLAVQVAWLTESFEKNRKIDRKVFFYSLLLNYLKFIALAA